MSITENLNEDRYVAFLDVLGFKELVIKKGVKLDKYFETISKALNDINSDKTEITSQLISDSTILACNMTNDNFKLLLRAVQTIQSRCAIENIWIRGAITVGDIFFDRNLNIVVGNGLSDAYLLETQEKFPRVIIDPKIIVESFENRLDFIRRFNNHFKTKKLEVVPLIHNSRNPYKIIESDAFFVSFAERIAYENIDNLELVYNHIKRELYSGQKNYAKYFWLKNYFTEAIKVYIFNNREKIDIKKLSQMAGKFEFL